MYSALLAAGAVWFDGMSATGRRWVAAGCLAGITLGLFVALPLLPAQALEGRDLTGELSETVGWPELVEQVRVVYETIPMADRDETVIFTGSYGEAGAIDVLGPGLGLPSAASGHNSYWHWGPPDGDGPIIGVGYAEAALRPMCPGLERVATISNPYGVSNEEAGLPIVVCLEPSSSLAREWPRLRHYN